MAQRLTAAAKLSGLALGLGGAACLALAPLTGAAWFDSLWGVEPLTYLGALLLIIGLAAAAGAYAAESVRRRREGAARQNRQWRETTRQFFELFDHDLGRPLRRIAGKERELRAVLQASAAPVDPSTRELLDEIERQTLNFRLMLANIQALVQLEAPDGGGSAGPVEPAEVVRRIADRYLPAAAEAGKHISWWPEPPEFGLVYSDANAIEHAVANLVDNAVRFAGSQVEVRLTRSETHFLVQVWDDGPGIAPQYLNHIFDRGWTPELARREEKSTSGLGLFIAHTLARRCGGALTVESTPAPQENHHTTFLLQLPLNGPPPPQ